MLDTLISSLHILRRATLSTNESAVPGAAGARRQRSGMPSFVPIWHWHPAIVGLFVFAIDFGVIAVIRVIERRANLLDSSHTYLLGDSIALPLYAAMAAVIVQSWEPGRGRFFLRWRWHAALVGLGIALAVLIDGAALVAGTESVLARPTASKVYHTIVFVPMFYLVASAFPPLLDARKPRPAALAALTGLVLYLYLAMSDLSAGAGQLIGSVV